MEPNKQTDSHGYGAIQQKDGETPESLLPHHVDNFHSPSGYDEDDLRGAFLGELFGTWLLVQLGTSSNCVVTYTQGAVAAVWPVAAVWTLALTIAIYVSSPLSGGHLNPAVSLAFALVRPDQFDIRRKLIPYVVAQFLGAILAGVLNLLIFHKAIAHFEAKNNIVRGAPDSYKSAVGFGDYYSLNHTDVAGGAHAFFIEAFGTMVLVFVIFSLTSRKNTLPGTAIPPVIGITLGVLITMFGGMTGASFNPARDLGPRFVTFLAHWGTAALQDIFPYIFAALVGGPIGAFLADKVLYAE